MNEIEKLKSEIDELKRKLKNKVDNQKKGMSESIKRRNHVAPSVWICN